MADQPETKGAQHTDTRISVATKQIVTRGRASVRENWDDLRDQDRLVLTICQRREQGIV